MSGPELQQELDQLVKQEEELVKNILKCREKLKMWRSRMLER